MSASWRWRDGSGAGGTGDALPGLEQRFDGDSLVALRSAVAAHGGRLGLEHTRLDDLILVAHELATNAVRHGGGKGHLRMWRMDDSLFCEVSDEGPGFKFTHPDRTRQPSLGATGGRGLWIVAQLVDLVHVHHEGKGTVVVIEFRLGRTATKRPSRPTTSESRLPSEPRPDGGPGSG
jgi:anti-sigma regulatory factor (Ser/Thr protein kinase)